MLSNRWVVCWMAVSFLGLTGCGVQPEEKVDPIKCTSNDDCKRTEICRLAPSEPTVCGGAGCVIRARVVEGRCESKPVPPPRPPQPSVCSKDSDCKRGERCLYTGVATGTRRIQGRCAPIQVEPPPVTCYQDSDCAQNERCEMDPMPGTQGGGAPTQGAKEGSAPAQGTSSDSTTQVFPCMPQPTGRCVAKPPAPKSCTSDADCAQGEHCEHYATCAGLNCPPPPPSACVPNPPAPKTCVQDGDCAQGEICYNLPCDAENCGSSYCIAKPVEPDPRRCEADADCTSGQRCEHYATCTAIGCPPTPPSVCVDIKP